MQGNAYAQSHYRLNVDGTVDADFREDYLDPPARLPGRRPGRWQRRLRLRQRRAVHRRDLARPDSPHTPYAYPKELEGTSAEAKYPRTPDFDEADVSDKFGLTRTRKQLSASDLATIDETFRKRIRSVQVLDQTVAELVQSLADQGALDNTYLMLRRATTATSWATTGARSGSTTSSRAR